MRDIVKKRWFWNVVFKVRKNPTFTGNHVNANCTHVHTTFPVETKKEDMIKLFEAEEFNMKWTNGDVHEVLGIDKIFVDNSGR